MSNGNQDFNILGEIRREFLHFASSYAKAVKSGANVAGQGLLEELAKLEQPSDIGAKKLAEALKRGVQHAGEQFIASEIDILDRLKKKKKSK